MKSFKMNSVIRLVSFILIAILLICIVGVAANGWQSQSSNGSNNSGEGGEGTDKTDGNTNENQDSNTDSSTTNNDITQNIPPKYFSVATGLEISEEKFNSPALGFVFDLHNPLYGIANADLSIEFFTEKDTSRMLAYNTDTSVLWKIGSLTATRAYITAMTDFFGGIAISTNNDDIVEYNKLSTNNTNLYLSSYTDSYYIENASSLYTTIDMVNTALNKTAINKDSTYKNMPFEFSNNDDGVTGTTNAKSVIIPFSERNETELYYSEESKTYTFFKSGSKKIDMLSGKNIEYNNIFILFANSTTYEKSEGAELVFDVWGSGKGYYISKGQMTEFKWHIDESGALNFFALNGEKLQVNRGNSYITYYKASLSHQIIFS